MAGIDVLAEPVRVRHAIGVVAQKHGADPEATGRENLVLSGEFYGITGRELRQRVTQSLGRFGLDEAADRKARTYSAACSAGWTSRWACCTGRRCCSSMSRRPGSTPRRGWRCGARSSVWPPRSG